MPACARTTRRDTIGDAGVRRKYMRTVRDSRPMRFFSLERVAWNKNHGRIFDRWPSCAVSSEETRGFAEERTLPKLPGSKVTARILLRATSWTVFSWPHKSHTCRTYAWNLREQASEFPFSHRWLCGILIWGMSLPVGLADSVNKKSIRGIVRGKSHCWWTRRSRVYVNKNYLRSEEDRIIRNPVAS